MSFKGDTKEGAIQRAKDRGIPLSQVVVADKGGYWLAPIGVTSDTAKKGYANCRENGGDMHYCAAISFVIQSNHDKKHSKD